MLIDQPLAHSISRGLPSPNYQYIPLLMYIPSSPHLLAHFNPGPIPPLDVLQALPPTPPNPQDKPHPAGYVALAVVISILLLLLVAFFTIRHRVAAVLLCTARRAKKDNKSVTSPRMQREGCSSFLGGFDLVPASSVRTGSRSGSGASCIPSSPNSSSEGPSTPSLGEHEHEHGDLGLGHTGKNSNDGSAIVPTVRLFFVIVGAHYRTRTQPRSWCTLRRRRDTLPTSPAPTFFPPTLPLLHRLTSTSSTMPPRCPCSDPLSAHTGFRYVTVCSQIGVI